MINSKKAAVEAARRRWLYRHQHLFKPLLPASNHFFANLADEIAQSTDASVYVPREDLEVQPALVTGGEMKDYQASLAPLPAVGVQLISVAPRSLILGVDVSQR